MLYTYDGPVKGYRDRWHGETFAESEKKAMSNLKYQFKKKYNIPLSKRIELTGKLKLGG